MPLTWLEQVQIELFGEDKPAKGWMEKALFSFAPYKEVFCAAYGSKFFICLRGGDIVRSFERLRTITAVRCIAVNSSANAQSRSQTLWTAFIVGYANGAVEVLDEAGECLVKREFGAVNLTSESANLDQEVFEPVQTKDPVQNIFLSTNPDDTGVSDMLNAISLLDVIVVYSSFVVAISGLSLYDALSKNKARVAEMKARGDSSEELDSVRRRVACRRYLVRQQDVRDAVVVYEPNKDYDQFFRRSMSNSVIETSLKSLAMNVTFITLGEGPFLQFNSPFNVEPLKLSEIGGNVVSTVKSGIIRAATAGLSSLWGGGASRESESQAQNPLVPESKMAVVYSLEDPPKSGEVIKLSPNKLYVAILDNQNRLLALDARMGTILNVWKGYHHAEIGWILASDELTKSDRFDEYKVLRVSCLLAVYLPRRGSLEVWSVERRTRLAEFPVSKHGKLVSAERAILDSNRRAENVPFKGSFFMDEHGEFFDIVVPMTSVVNLSSASHDLLQEKRLHHLLKDDSFEGCYAELEDKIKELIHDTQTVDGKKSLVLCALRSRRVSTALSRNLLDVCKPQTDPEGDDEAASVASEDKEQVQKDNYAYFHKGMEHLFKLFSFLAELEPDPGQTEPTIDALTKGLSCGNLQASATLSMMQNPPGQPLTPKGNSEENDFYFGSLLSVIDFSMDQSISGEATKSDFPPVSFKTTTTEDLTYQRMCLAALRKREELSELCRDSSLNPSNFLNFIINCSLAYHPISVEILAGQEALLTISLELFGIEGMKFVSLARKNLTFAPLNSTLYLAALCFAHAVASHEDDKISRHAVELQWLISVGVTAETFETDPFVVGFISNCGQFFPLSIQPITLMSHITWEYFRQWDQQKAKLDLMQEGICFLKALAAHGDNEKDIIDADATSQRLGVLIWSTFLRIVIRDCVNYTEIRSSQRFLRDLGLNEEHIPRLLVYSVRMAKFLAQSSTLPMRTDVTRYDDLALTPKWHLLDHLSAICTDALSDVFALQFQFVLVISLMWGAGVSCVKPLYVFSRQDTNVFFHGETRNTIFTLGLNSHLTNVRRQFMKEAIEKTAVTLIHMVPEDNPEAEEREDQIQGKLVTEDYLEQHGWLFLLSKMWNIPEFQIEESIVCLYKLGHDSLATEQLSAYPDRGESLGHKLLHVAIVRLSKYVYEHENHLAKIGTLRPRMLDQLAVVQEEAMSYPEVRLMDTEVLLVQLCNFNMDSDALRVAQECLSLVISYRKSDRKKQKK